jgi:anti-sigma regulatory factor (Ser/Thr protein kinase)
VADRVALAVSEVVTNAVKHAQSNAVLFLRHDEGRLEVRVQDDNDSLPTLQKAVQKLSQDAD